MKTFKIGGIHPADNKLSAAVPFETVPLPAQVIIPLEQHIGAPTVAVVAKGDKVKAGQLIGEAQGPVSANIHSSVSGTVTKLDTVIDAWGYKRPAVYISVEGDEWMEGIDRSGILKEQCDLTPEEIIAKIKNAGIVGLGGACFPTHVKLVPPPSMTVDTLIVNAVECEPYLTHNHRLMLEKGREIMTGIEILKKALKVDKAVIGIEANKPDAIKYMEELAASHEGVSVQALKMKYPQGGEKQLIAACTGREVKSGAIPASVGVVVQNVATVFAVYEAVQLNKPLVEVAITISGPSVKHPGNYIIRIGTPLGDALAMAGGLPEDTGKIIGGGPMMGRAFMTTDVPATKRSAGLVLMPESLSKRRPVMNCIRCGKCVEACPMGLEPYLLAQLGAKQDWERSEKEKVTDCIECGSCMYTCPSNRPLLDYIRMSKAEVMGIIKARAKK